MVTNLKHNTLRGGGGGGAFSRDLLDQKSVTVIPRGGAWLQITGALQKNFVVSKHCIFRSYTTSVLHLTHLFIDSFDSKYFS